MKNSLNNSAGRSRRFALLPLSFASMLAPSFANAQASTKPVTAPTAAASAQSAPAASPKPAEATDILSQIDNALTNTVKRVRGMIVTIEGKLDPEDTRQFVRATLPFALIQALPAPDANGSRRTLSLKITGSGFIIKGGYVVTSAEVAAPMKEPVVVLADGRRARATLLKQDSAVNVAMFRVEGLDPELGVTWAASDQVNAGNLAITIGSQAGYSHSAALGMIAGTNRAGQSGSLRYENLIQFQGSVGADNSGGPLFNARGDLIGMIVATPASSGQRQQFAMKDGSQVVVDIPESPFSNLTTVGFAIPSNELRSVVEALKQGWPIERRGWLGVVFNFPEMNVPDSRPVIGSVYEGGPAYIAGLRPKDIVIEINGKKVITLRELRAAFGSYRPDAIVDFKLERDGKIIDLKAKTIRRPDEDTISKMKIIGAKLTQMIEPKEEKTG